MELVLLAPTLLLLILGRREEKGRRMLLAEISKIAKMVSRHAARKEELFVGMSSGAILYVALKKAKELGQNKCVVAVLPDSGEKYPSTPLFG